MGKTKKKSKKKKKKVKEVAAATTNNDDNGDLIDVCVEMNDRLDCLMDSDGNVIKHQVVGNVNLKYKLPQTAQPQPSQYFYANIGNLEQTKTKIFNPLSTEVLDDVNGQIRVKLSESEQRRRGEASGRAQICLDYTRC